MIVLLVIVAVLVLLLVMPFGVSARYVDGELGAAARVMCFNIKVLPRKEKPEKKKKAEKLKKEKKPKKEKPEKEKKNWQMKIYIRLKKPKMTNFTLN